MKKFIALALLLAMAVSVSACCIQLPEQSVEDYQEEVNNGEEETQPTEEERPEDPYAYIWEQEFEPIVVEGEGSVDMYAYATKMEFSLPTEIRHFDRMRQSSPGLVMLVHCDGVSGRTIVQIAEGSVEDAMRVNISSHGATVDEAEPYECNGYQGLYWSSSKTDMLGDLKVYTNYYYAALDVGNGQTVMIRVEPTYNERHTCDLTEDSIATIFSHCTIIN